MRILEILKFEQKKLIKTGLDLSRICGILCKCCWQQWHACLSNVQLEKGEKITLTVSRVQNGCLFPSFIKKKKKGMFNFF